MVPCSLLCFFFVWWLFFIYIREQFVYLYTYHYLEQIDSLVVPRGRLSIGMVYTTINVHWIYIYIQRRMTCMTCTVCTYIHTQGRSVIPAYIPCSNGCGEAEETPGYTYAAKTFKPHFFFLTLWRWSFSFFVFLIYTILYNKCVTLFLFLFLFFIEGGTGIYMYMN